MTLTAELKWPKSFCPFCNWPPTKNGYFFLMRLCSMCMVECTSKTVASGDMKNPVKFIKNRCTVQNLMFGALCARD